MIKQFIIFISITLFTFSATAQSKIKDGSISGASSLPGSNSILELESKKRGLLLPRLALVSTSFSTPLSAHVAGMVVYNTATVNDVTPGYYYNDGSSWRKMAYTTPSSGGGGNDLTNDNGIIITGGVGSTLKAASLRLDSTAIAVMMNQSPVKDSLSIVLSKIVMTSPTKDSLNKIISTGITGGGITGQDLTNSNGIIINGGTGTTLKSTSLRLDSTAIAKMLPLSPIKDSLGTVISSSILSGSITGQDLTNSNGIIVNGGIGTTLKSTSLRLDSTAIAKMLHQSPVKDSLNTVMSQIVMSTPTKDSLDKIIGSSFDKTWQLGGNALAQDTLLGTKNNYPIRMAVNGAQRMMIDNKSNIIAGTGPVTGGFSSAINENYIAPAAYNNFIMGQGDTLLSSNAFDNIVTGRDNKITSSHNIVGGQMNEASGQSNLLIGESNVNSGQRSLISGYSNTNSADASFIGGSINSNSGLMALIAGANNSNSGYANMVSGISNISNGSASLISGAGNNNNGGSNLLIGSGNTNTADGSLIAGDGNTNNCSYGLIGGEYCYSSYLWSAVWGSHDTSNGFANLVAGQYNKVDAHKSFAVGSSN